ncbi:alanine racemase [soil metagenome]
MPRPIEALIHVDSLAHNLNRARASAPDAKVWAVVKANAYGHGIERAFMGLQGADGFALLDLDEAQKIRDLGWRGPILLLEGCFEARDLELCSRLNLWHVVHREAQIDWLAAHKTSWPHRVFLKLNSGMNRLGFEPVAFRNAWMRLSGLTQVDEISLMTHFADADAGDSHRPADLDAPADRPPANIARQLAAFESATAGLAGERSLANSAATLRYAGAWPAIRGDWVRPGIMLYGSSPDHAANTAAHWQLLPTMTLRSHLISVQNLQRGDTVGYGSTFTAEAPMKVGVVACGYADGYPRHAPTGTPMLVNGVRTRLVGRVSMDMLTVELPADQPAAVGDEVTLWGRGPRDSMLCIDDVAAAAGTIGYELMCAVAARVPARAIEPAAGTVPVQQSSI